MNDSIRDYPAVRYFVWCVVLVGALLESRADLSAQSLTRVGEIHEVDIAVMDQLPTAGTTALLIRRPGETDVLAMSSANADVGTLLGLIALLRGVWDKDGVDAQTDAILRLRGTSARVARGRGAERAYATHAIRRVRSRPKTVIPGVGRGRVVKALVARSAS